MPATVHFVSGEAFKKKVSASERDECVAVGVNRVFALIGTKENVLSAAAEVLAALPSPVDVSLFQALVSQSSVSSHSGAHTHVVFSSPPGYVKVHALLVPTEASRHNSPARGEVIHSLVDKHLTSHENSEGSGKTAVRVVVVAPAANAYASCCALGRAYPLYSRKKNAFEKESDLDVVVTWYDPERGYQSDEAATTLMAKIEVVVEGIRHAARLVDMPCNELPVSGVIKEVHTLMDSLKNQFGEPFVSERIRLNVIVGEELKERGFGGIYGVGKAAADPPALVTLEYVPPQGYNRTFVWVGKGIVYDTGGLCLKGPTSMPGMKRDMGGSAAIFCAWASCVRTHYLLSDTRLVAVLCLAENSVGPLATRPDDIHVMYSGKTVEINNTDAEGRLVLADGVAYAVREYQPNLILDMCTLTGAQGISTGRLHAAIVCNDEETEKAVVLAGKSSGDLTFPLLYCPELFQNEFKSSVADMKNSVADRSNAQSSCAAQFIASHLGDFNGKWIHVDMAAPVHSGERATGYGVALLCDMIEKIPK